MAASPKLIAIGVAVKSADGAIGPSLSQSRKCSRRRIVGRNIGCCSVADGRKITSEVIGIAYGATGGDDTTSVS